MLEGFRALDLTDHKGVLCGRVLADLGVDVIKVERPGGDPSRNIGPFYKDKPHPEMSLFWFAFNANKRGITLDVETSDGRELFKRLLAKSDFVIESFPPGYMEGIGLGYSSLRAVNPRIIMTSITPFGQTGPYRDYKATDIELMALGGMLYVTGDPDRPPVRLSYPMAYHLASAFASGGALTAHYHREMTGEGQYIDVSAQQSVTWVLLNTRQWWEFQGTISGRTGQLRERRAGFYLRIMWACKDGGVTFHLHGGAMGPRTNKALAQWIVEEGMADDFFRDFDWDGLDWPRLTQELLTRLEDTIARFFLTHTKEELYEQAIKRRIMLAPIRSIPDIAQSRQLASRQFWVDVEHPELGQSLTYPGAFIKASLTPCPPRRRAPLIGEHNEEVYGEIGVSKEELVVLKQGGII